MSRTLALFFCEEGESGFWAQASRVCKKIHSHWIDKSLFIINSENMFYKSVKLEIDVNA